VEVIEESFFLELVSLVKDDNARRALVLAEAVVQFVARCGLPMDIDVLPKPFKDTVKGAELREVLPAVDVLVLNVEDFLAELFGGILRETRLSDTRRPNEQGRLSGITVGERGKNFGEMRNFCVPMHDLSGYEASTEDTSIGYHRSRYQVHQI